MKYILLLLVLSASLSANPWGKDADLAFHSPRNEVSPCQTPVLGGFAETMIGFHQNVISPADGPRSHFKPSSSQYTLDAMRKYGFFQGFVMGCDRLMRENQEEWVYHTAIDEYGTLIKLDPVP